MKRKVIPLARPDIRNEDIREAARVMKSGMLVQGKEVAELEQTISKMVGNHFCSAVSNGTASLHLALLSLGIKPGDEVIVPAFSFVATANVVELVGAKSVFVDIHPRYFNIDESRIEAAITERTKVLIPVHEFGLCANMPAIMKIAGKHNLKIIEDAACALGSSFNGNKAGTFGDFGSFSLHPRKAVTSGEGGLLVTANKDLDSKIKAMRNHGIEHGSLPMNFLYAGFNYRMTDFQAALVHNQIKRLDEIIRQRKKIASVYLNDIKNSSFILPEIPEGADHIWQTFHLLTENHLMREKLLVYLKTHGIMANYGAQCIPAMTYYRKKYEHDSQKNFPNAFNAFMSGVAIPLFEKLNDGQIKHIVKILNKFH